MSTNEKKKLLQDNRSSLLLTARIIAIIFTIIWMFVIFRFSSDTNIQSHALSDRVTDIFNRIIEIVTGRNLKMTISPENYAFIELGLRKLAHMFIYFILSISIMLFLFTFKIPMFIRMIITSLFCFLYACIDEFHQSFVSGRGASFFDSIIDTGGAILGILASLVLYCIIYTIYHRIQERKIQQYNNKINNT